MKPKTKLQNWIPAKLGGLALATLLVGSAGVSFAQTADLPIQNFDADDSSGNRWGHEWGPGTQAFDGANGNPPGALLVTGTFSASSDTPITTYICLNGNPWYVGTPINFSQYKAIEFDIKWDNTSDISISQFNNVATIPITQTNSAGQLCLNSLLNAGSIGGLEIQLCGGPGGQMAPFIINTNIPAAAANGWVHMVIPIDPSTANLDGCSGFVFHKWVSQYNGQIANDFQGRFWIDNVSLQGTAAPPPPPTVNVPTKATQGLNVFTSTGGIYDRQSAVLRQNVGLSWVGMASEANPVSYSFTIAGYPNSVNCEAWLFLVPNPAYLDGAPDWNETNCVKIRLQGSANNGTMQFQYKINENNQQAMYTGGSETRTSSSVTNNYYYTAAPGSLPGGPIIDNVSPGVYNITNESGYLGFVTNDTILGTWTIRFTSDTNLTLIAPNGNSTNLVFPAHNVGLFAEQTSPGFYVYLGLQANNVDAMNQAVVFSNFSISNTAMPFSEDFLTDTELDTTTVWTTAAASGPKGVFVVPAGASKFITWTLPASGFTLESGSDLINPTSWKDANSFSPVSMVGLVRQLLSSNDWSGRDQTYFRLVKRAFTKLQILLPGETAAPGTATGKTGTPTPQPLGWPFTVTINAVDATWHVMPNVTDTLDFLTSTDPAFGQPPFVANLVNGTVTIDVSMGTVGDQTITVSDQTDPTKTSATSSAVSVTNP